ncbi:hypothetical protein BKA56DRAFT_620247 [Ilyonectria sp. MPI-CAGE-AT-0026]|nr:hypothetical protein BKA56DRAFT_620247 [Ilyonectria sp. MPI-CAGE-AT-0026]
MRLLNLFAIAGALVPLNAAPTCAEPKTSKAKTECSRHPVSPWIQEKKFDAFVHKFYVLKEPKAAILENMAVDYIQHNPDALSGRQNAIDYVGPTFEIANFTVARTSFSNSTGWAHTKMEIPGAPFIAVVDIFRFEGTCIVEHWDVFLQLPANATNPLALF